MPAAATANEQVIEAVVSGPDGANRLYTCTGMADLNTWVSANQSKQETWTFLVGPALPERFLRATASVSVAGYGVYIADPTNAWHNLAFSSVEADWDDESSRTEARVEVLISARGMSFTLSRIGFSVTVLAALPSA